MSRSDYDDDLDNWALIKYRGQVASAMRGKRGQRLLRDMAAALDGMADKRLIADKIEDSEGMVCALGAVAKFRGVSEHIDVDDTNYEEVADMLDIARPLAREVAFMNDEWFTKSPEHRWAGMRRWVD